MPMTISRVLLRSGRSALLLRNEKGHKLFYDDDGVTIVNVGDDFEVKEEIGRVENESEFTELTGLRPSLFLTLCPFCNKESLVERARQGWKCVRCDNIMPEEEAEDYVH